MRHRLLPIGWRLGAWLRPKGFHRIRHYGLFASANRAETNARARELLQLATPMTQAPRSGISRAPTAWPTPSVVGAGKA